MFMNKNSEKPSQISSDFEAIHFFARRTILLVLLSSVSVFSFSQFTDSGINLGSGGYNNCIWGDYDNDGDQDILLSGYYSKIFRNNGNKTFTEISVPFNVIGYTATWIDFDNDNDLDIFLGNRLYKNMGGDIFKEVLIEDMNDYNMGVSYFSSVDVKDYDNDGDEDLLIGYEGKILIFNNRDGKFLLVDQRLMGGENLGNLYINNFWIDAYNTGYYDILYSKLYKNNSRNLYSPDPNFNINGAGNELSVADYNSDGFMDALFTGYASASIMMKNINGTFTNANLTSLMNVYGGGVSKFGDYNNDGQVDFILDGSLLFTNTGSSDFTKSYPNLGLGSVWDEDWGDFDNDGDLDLILTSGSGTKIFENGQINTNIPPPVPSNLVNTINGNSVTFSWDRPIDAETPSAGLTYNICLINVSINDTIKPPGANLTTGKLLEPKAGNTQSNNFWKIKGLKPGDYKWTVQAIDHSFAGSAFAIFNTFQITSSCTVSPATTQVIDPNLNGSLLTVTETVAVTSRIWAYSLFPGGPYTSIIQGATNTTYTPNFQEDGRYFIMCKSVAGSDTLFSNEIMVEVLPFTGTSVPGIPNYYYNGSMKPGDSDNDGDLDLLITGNGGTNLYVNTTNSYSPVSITTGLINGYAAWFDYNNDNKLDFIITGTSGTKSTRIFINQGNNAFSELTHDIIGLEFGSIDAGDYDHD
ncbi:MAG: VCBS repeat-containing protein, partial [Bacteroidetes bacterium]